jgi:DNA gyrase inhibitor GyrI
MKLFMKILIAVTALAVLAALVNAGCASVRAGYESAPYQVVRRDGKFELRDYPALVVAETPMRGADNSFLRLFHFIGGENAAKQKISMTTPVFMNDTGGTNATMAFVMPAKSSLNDLPQPSEPGVTLKQIPAGEFAVLRFSGGRNAKNETNSVARLTAWLTQEKIAPTGQPVFAYFDPPWTPPFLRRNEVMLRVAQP